jgi:hypothetical protein
LAAGGKQEGAAAQHEPSSDEAGMSGVSAYVAKLAI